VQGDACLFAAETATCGIGGRDATCVVWPCDNGYHAVCYAETPGRTDEYSTYGASSGTDMRREKMRTEKNDALDEKLHEGGGLPYDGQTDRLDVKLEEDLPDA
jgi:hypothetical protein